MSNILDGTDVDFLSVFVGREEVEACDPTEVLKTLNKLTANRLTALKFMDKVNIGVHGYDDDSRELFEIPEVRLFFSELDRQFPFLFFFLSTATGALTLLALLLCRITRISPTRSAYDQEDFANFINSHLAAMNHVFDSFQLSEELNEQRSDELAQYFLKAQIQT
jgi:hypothetical protein